ncbi:glycosyltransferase [bacterium]|nr:glycosyltransferase [bacterium]
MRILFLSYAYPNAGQPQLATFNRTMLAALSAVHEVRVVAPVPFLQAWRHPPQPTGDRILSNVAAEYPAFYYPPKLCRELYDDFLWWSIRSVVRRTIAEFQPEIILSYWAHPDGTVAVRAAEEADIPAVIMVGGSDVLLLGRTGRRRDVILKTLSRAAAVIAVSQDLADTLREDGISTEKTYVVPRGIDHTVFHPGDRATARQQLGLPLDRPVVVGVGRLVDVKDWPTWIAACGELRQRGGNPACYVLGSGPLETPLRRQIAESGLTDIVEFRGSQSQLQLAQWYRAADVTVLSSRSEGVPNVLLETMASGGSFVATNVGGIAEIADPVYDRLVPPAQPRALAEAIADRLQHVPPEGLTRRFEPASSLTAARKLTEIFQHVRHEAEPVTTQKSWKPCLT